MTDTPLHSARREFLSTAAGVGVGLGGLALLSACGSGDSTATPTPTASATATATATATSTPTPSAADMQLLNVALNLEYLAANYYGLAATGAGVPATQTAGVGTVGVVTGGRLVNFTDADLGRYAREIAADKLAHVAYLRTVLGSAAVAQPAINIAGDATGAFTTLARTATVAAATGTFDPYASDANFLLGAYVLEDVLVTAYRGLTALVSTTDYTTIATRLAGATAYHAGLIRSVIYVGGTLRAQAALFSDARDSFDGAIDRDQGVTGSDAAVSNIVPTDLTGLVYSRTTGQVLNIFYQNKAAVVGGGFFPAGVNGDLKTSAASG